MFFVIHHSVLFVRDLSCGIDDGGHFIADQKHNYYCHELVFKMAVKLVDWLVYANTPCGKL